MDPSELLFPLVGALFLPKGLQQHPERLPEHQGEGSRRRHQSSEGNPAAELVVDLEPRLIRQVRLLDGWALTL